MDEIDVELRWWEDEQGFRCVLPPAPTRWDGLAEWIEFRLKPGVDVSVTLLSLYIGFAVVMLGLFLLYVGLEPQLAGLCALIVFGVTRFVLGALLLPYDEDWIAVLHQGRFDVLKGSRTVFSAPLHELTMDVRGDTICFQGGRRDLTIATGVSIQAIQRLQEKLAIRAEAYGNPTDAPSTLAREVLREHT